MEFLSLSEAMSRFVPDGAQVALEGFTHLIPFAAGHELIRQGRRDLHLVRMTPDLVYDQLIGTGCARRLTFSWGGNPGVGSLHRFRDAVERGWPAPLELDEHTHAGMAAAYAAGRLASSWLYEVRASDPVILAGAFAVVVTVTVVATLIPARRVSRTDPAHALRAD